MYNGSIIISHTSRPMCIYKVTELIFFFSSIPPSSIYHRLSKYVLFYWPRCRRLGGNRGKYDKIKTCPLCFAFFEIILFVITCILLWRSFRTPTGERCSLTNTISGENKKKNLENIDLLCPVLRYLYYVIGYKDATVPMFTPSYKRKYHMITDITLSVWTIINSFKTYTIF